jgi:DNA-binding transcriptional LysR family regulator
VVARDQRMDDLRQLKRGRVSLSTVSTAGAYVVLPLLGAFRARQPGIVLSPAVTNRATVVRRLAQNEVA